MLARNLVSLLLLLLMPHITNAIEYDCQLGNDQRFIRLDYPGQDHLCEVSVTGTDNERKVKWYADINSEFCTSKIVELVNKYTDLWQFKCQSKPDRIGIASLTGRQLNILDDTTKRVSAEGKSADIPFIVTGIRIHTTELQSTRSTAIVAQLFIQTTEADIETDRTYFFQDDGDQYTTTAIFAGLKQNIKLLDDRFKVNSAIISAVRPTGVIEVDTTLLMQNENPTDTPRCLGSQFFKPNDSGSLDPVNSHQHVCNF